MPPATEFLTLPVIILIFVLQGLIGLALGVWIYRLVLRESQEKHKGKDEPPR